MECWLDFIIKSMCFIQRKKLKVQVQQIPKNIIGKKRGL